jgi:4-nitrophenyl phosphatase
VTYEKLKLGALAIRAGAQFVLTNPDYTLPTEAGLIPDAGALAAGLQSATDVAPLVIGKPEPPMFRVALDLLGGAPATALVIGDRLETDIAGARTTGLSSALVLTGVSRRDELEASPHKPDAVYADLPALLAAWRGSGG